MLVDSNILIYATVPEHGEQRQWLLDSASESLSVAVPSFDGRDYGRREIRIRSPRTVRIAPSASSCA